MVVVGVEVVIYRKILLRLCCSLFKNCDLVVVVVTSSSNDPNFEPKILVKL